MEQEDEYLALLLSVSSYDVQQGRLILYTRDGQELVFIQQEPDVVYRIPLLLQPVQIKNNTANGSPYFCRSDPWLTPAGHT